MPVAQTAGRVRRGWRAIAIVTAGKQWIEQFNDIQRLLAREHELLAAWRAQGWRMATGA